ncbi:MAG: HAD family hydrolase [Clostridia bacterium]|nr:HAD family hydrolase [Clostridia bacterium]
MNRAVIFDLDGTVLDSLKDIADNVNKTLDKFGNRRLSLAEIKSIVGNGAKRLIEDALKLNGIRVSEAELGRILGYYNRIYAESESPYTKPFDGIKETLKELSLRGYKIAILSNKPQKTLERVCSLYLNDIKIDRVVGEKDGVKCKPDKTATVALLKELGVTPESCYFVGDGETDVIASIGAGTNCIAVLWGNRTKEELAAAGAKVFAEKPADLLYLIP